jgi:hypothetical protein
MFLKVADVKRRIDGPGSIGWYVLRREDQRSTQEEK